MKIFEQKDPEGNPVEKDTLWWARALRGDFGSYTFQGPYNEDTEPFGVMVFDHG